MKIKTIITDIFLAVFALAGIAVLTISAVNADRWFDIFWSAAETKIISFIILHVFVARVSSRVLRNKNQINKYTINCFIALLLTILIFFINNFWHYAGFASMFNWPDDVSYLYFINYDLNYNLGLGIFRYVIAFFTYFAIYFSVDIRLIDKLANFVSGIFEKVGLYRLFGIADAEELSEDDINRLRDIVMDDENIRLYSYKTEEKQQTRYVIEIDRTCNL